MVGGRALVWGGVDPGRLGAGHYQGDGTARAGAGHGRAVHQLPALLCPAGSGGGPASATIFGMKSTGKSGKA